MLFGHTPRLCSLSHACVCPSQHQAWERPLAAESRGRVRRPVPPISVICEIVPFFPFPPFLLPLTPITFHPHLARTLLLPRLLLLYVACSVLCLPLRQSSAPLLCQPPLGRTRHPHAQTHSLHIYLPMCGRAGERGCSLSGFREAMVATSLAGRTRGVYALNPACWQGHQLSWSVAPQGRRTIVHASARDGP